MSPNDLPAPTSVVTSPASSHPTTRQKHPRGLATLFFTEMWERFSYYGMRALLVLFMVDSVRHGLGLDDKTATAIYGLYTGAVYLMSLPGGWLADRLWGGQRAVWYGGIIIAAGHFTLALPWLQTFYLGLILLVVGSGILKPNMSGMVGELYPEAGSRRDAGFSIFYMGINLGAAVGPLICGWLARNLGWHYGFGAAGVGMVLGLIQFRLTRHHLGSAGLHPTSDKKLNLLERLVFFGGTGLALVVAIAAFGGFIKINPVAVAQSMAYLILTVASLFFIYAFLFCQLDKIEKERLVVILILFLASALFWSGFEQAGSSFNLFAERSTILAYHLASFHFEVPAAWFQSLGPVFVISLAPVFAALWVWLGRRNLDPSIPAKFAWGLLLLAAGFLVMASAAKVVASGHKAWPTWLITTYLIHTFGELCLSPVGLSSVTKLAPRKLAGQIMGLWFIANSLGSLFAGLIAGEFNPDAVQQWPALYYKIVILPAIAGVLLIIFCRPIKRLMVGVK